MRRAGLSKRPRLLAFRSSLHNGMNRGSIVATELGDLHILQNILQIFPHILQDFLQILPHILQEILQILPLSSNRIEERRADVCGDSPEKKLAAGRHQREVNAQDEKAKKLKWGKIG